MVLNKTIRNTLADEYRKFKRENHAGTSSAEKYFNFLMIITINLLLLLLWPFLGILLVADFSARKQKEKKEIDGHKRAIEALMKEIIGEKRE